MVKKKVEGREPSYIEVFSRIVEKQRIITAYEYA
jgi:hypothetical protein